MENLLDEKFGKHDYDWLVSPPPGTPVPNGRSSTRSVSTTRASRFSAPHSENINSTRPVRSRSVTRSSSHNNRTSVLNASLASATSQIANQGKHSVIARSSSTPARLSTPVRTRPPSPSSGVKTARPQRNSRPSSPTNLNRNATPLASRANSRSSTPTQRPLAPTIVRSRSVGQIPRPKVGLSSPATRAQVSVQPSERQRAAMAASVDSNLDTTSLCLSRRHSLPLLVSQRL